VGVVRRVDVRIDRLVLRGFDPADGKAFASALTAELSRALGDPTLRMTSRRMPISRFRSVGAGERKDARSSGLGARVAKAVGRAVKS
jgi:hypothetical protein